MFSGTNKFISNENLDTYLNRSIQGTDMIVTSIADKSDRMTEHRCVVRNKRQTNYFIFVNRV